MSLNVENLSLQRGTRVLQERLSFALDSGQVLWVRGPNGVGKSTLLETLCGFRPVFSGEITWAGHSLKSDMDAYHEALEYIGHKNGNNPNLSAQNALGFYASLYCSNNLNNAMKAVGLERAREVFVKELSAGQQKRLALARLLLRKTPLWVLDEAPVSLDAQGTALLVSMIKTHLEQGGLVVMTSHVDLGLKAKELQLKPIQKSESQAGDAFLVGDWHAVR